MLLHSTKTTLDIIGKDVILNGAFRVWPHLGVTA
jgi:hypothetical protein